MLFHSRAHGGFPGACRQSGWHCDHACALRNIHHHLIPTARSLDADKAGLLKLAWLYFQLYTHCQPPYRLNRAANCPSIHRSASISALIPSRTISGIVALSRSPVPLHTWHNVCSKLVTPRPLQAGHLM